MVSHSLFIRSYLFSLAYTTRITHHLSRFGTRNALPQSLLSNGVCFTLMKVNPPRKMKRRRNSRLLWQTATRPNSQPVFANSLPLIKRRTSKFGTFKNQRPNQRMWSTSIKSTSHQLWVSYTAYRLHALIKVSSPLSPWKTSP